MFCECVHLETSVCALASMPPHLLWHGGVGAAWLVESNVVKQSIKEASKPAVPYTPS